MHFEFKKAKNGYTIIELLFAVSIMAVIFGVGFANLRGFQRRQLLENYVRQVKADLRLAQELALAGKKPSESANDCDTANLSGYTFRFYNNYPPALETDPLIPDEYEIYAECPDWGNRVLIKGPIEIPIPFNISSSGMPGQRIKFNILGRGTDVVSATLTFRYEGILSTSRTITVTSTGQIQ